MEPARSSAFVNAAQSRLSTGRFAFDSRLILSPTGRPPSCHVIMPMTSGNSRVFTSGRPPARRHASFFLRNIRICLIGAAALETLALWQWSTTQTRNLLPGSPFSYQMTTPSNYISRKAQPRRNVYWSVVTRVCVCLSVPRRIPTLLHGPADVTWVNGGGDI